MSERLTRLLLTAYGPPDDGVPDADLLARVAAGRDAVAFELLVRRHAGLVWRACAAVARDHHAAEDAFQAAFLALSRRAGALRNRSAAGWLYRVACRAALKAPRRGGQLLTPPSSEVPSPAPGPVELAERAEQAAIAHEELGRLPGRYREAVVLCHLQGLTQVEAARLLGLPLGTLTAHVRRGLARLRDRLVRRGVGLPAAGVVGLFGGGEAGAVPAPLVPLTTSLGVGTAVPAPAVARLTAGVLSAMNRSRIAALCLIVSVVTAGGMLLAFGPTTAAPPQSTDPSQPAVPTAAAAQKPGTKPADLFQRKASLERLMEVMSGWHRHADANDEVLPTDITDKNGRPLLSWRVAILPTLGEEYLYSQFKLDEPWDGPNNKKLLAFVPRVYRSSSDTAAKGETLVQTFSGPGAALEPGKKLRLPAGFPDGTSNTVGVVEAGPPVPWTKPADIPFDPKKPLPELRGPFSDGVAAALVSGDRRWLRRDVSAEVLRTLIMRNDGDITPGTGWGAAPPARPLTDDEQREVARLRKYYEPYRKSFAKQAEERARLTEELKKHGPYPFPELPTAEELRNTDDLLKLDDAFKRMVELYHADQREIRRLEDELEKRKKGQKK